MMMSPKKSPLNFLIKNILASGEVTKISFAILCAFAFLFIWQEIYDQ